jgi:hypothetical protein
MNKLKIFYLFILTTVNLSAQRIDSVWPIGYDCCGTFPWGSVNLDFNSGSLNMYTVQRHMNINVTNSFASDSSGNLLFTTNGIYVANANDDTMMNGNGLNPAVFTNNHVHYGLTTPQANVIIPSLTNPSQYILFHNTIDDYFNTGASLYLYYSIIDMTLDSGLGGVINKNTVLYSDSMVAGRISACRHANGRDWWILLHEISSSLVFEFLYTPFGFQGPNVKNLIAPMGIGVGQAMFNPQGTMFAYYNPFEDLDIANFDRCTGDLTNQIHIDINDSAAVGGLAFSPSGRYLYISSMKYLYQFDTWASNIDSSRITVGVYDGYIDTIAFGNSTQFYLAQLAPDGKIYISCTNSNPYLHVINYPDSAGLACDFCQHCIVLPVLNAFTIPSYPNYYLGADSGSVCDTLTNGLPVFPIAVASFTIFPNPATDVLYITQDKGKQLKQIEVFNSIGQIQQVTYSFLKSGDYVEINIGPLAPGIYFIDMQTKDQRVVKKFVRE